MEITKYTMTIRELSKSLGIPETYIRRGVKAGTIPFIQSGNRALINVPLFLKQLDRESMEGING